MAVLSRVNLTGQKRFDVSDGLAIDSFNAADFRSLVSTFLGTDRAYVVRGLEVVSKNGLTIGVKVAGCQILNPQDENGSFYAGLDDDENILVNLPADQTNIFVEAQFINITQNPVNSGYWDPLAGSGDNIEGEEFTASVDFQEVIQLEIKVNTVGFTAGALPLLRASTSASAVTAFTDSRPLLFRLGTGGANPDPLNKYDWSPSRTESVPSGTGVANDLDSPWRSLDATGSVNDKAFGSLKDWMDAVMSMLSEVTGSAIWYQSLGGSGPGSVNVSLNQLWFDTIGHSLQPSKTAAFKWSDNSGLKLSGEGIIPLNGTTSLYHSGLVKWKMNQSSLEWQLGGTFSNNIPGGNRNYLSTGLRFSSPTPADGGNLYLALERDVEKGSGNSVSWGDAGTSPFIASEAVSGNAGDFSGIALGDYIRKESGSYTSYHKVVRMWNGSAVFNNSLDTDENQIADSSIISLELESTLDAGATVVTASNEKLLFFRSRYSDDDLIADEVAGQFTNQDVSFYWMGRRVGDLFFLKDYGTMQEGEEVTTLDSVYAHGQGGSSSGESLRILHAKESIYESVTNGYSLKTGTGNLLTIERRKRDNTVDTDAVGDNTSSQLSYTLDAPVGLMTIGQSLWVRLSETTSGALSAGSVTNTTDDEDNTDTLTNRWEVRDPADSPTKTFDNIDVFRICTKTSINGQDALIFEDGSIVTDFGQMINTNLDISGEVRLNDYDNTAIPFVAEDGSKLLDQDSTNFFFDKNLGRMGIFNLRIENNNIFQNTPEDISILSNLGAHTATLGTSESTVRIPGDLIVEGETFVANTKTVQSEDKLISLGSGAAVDANAGGGLELADDSKISISIEAFNGLDYVDLIYSSAHGYSLGQIFGVNATDDIGGITAGQISGQYTMVASVAAPYDAEILTPTSVRLYTRGTATANEFSTTLPPVSFVSPWSFRLGASDGSYTGIDSWVFRTKNVTTTPTLTPFLGYGIVPTAHSVNMEATRIPFVNDDNVGPSGKDTTLDFSSNFTWNDSTSTFCVIGTTVLEGNLNPKTTDTHSIGTDALRWLELRLSNASGGLYFGDARIYGNGVDSESNNIIQTPDAIYSENYISSDKFVRVGNTTSLTGFLPLPASGANIFERDGLIWSQDSAGDQKLLTNVDGNVYEEISTTVSVTTPEIPKTEALPLDTKHLLATTPVATTDGASPNVTVTINNHGLTGSELINVYASVAIGGIPANDLSLTGVPIVIVDPNTFFYAANSSSSSVDSGFLDRITTTKLRRYTVGSGELEIEVNGVGLTIGEDYDEIGNFGTESASVNFTTKIDLGDHVKYRIDSNGGKVVISQAGGGASDMQSAYDGGSSLVVTTGNPFVISGPASEKLFKVLGDIEVTGVIDPAGIQFTPQASNPLESTHLGLYSSNNTDKDLMYARGILSSVNLTQDFLYRDGSKAMTGNMDMDSNRILNLPVPSFNSDPTRKDYVDSRDRYKATYASLENNTGVTIPAGSVVKLSATDNSIELADATNIANAQTTIGVVLADILDTESGYVQLSGILESTTTLLTVGSLISGSNVYVSETPGSATGSIPATTDTAVYILGSAISSGNLIINPQFVTVNSNIYEENILVVAGAPADDNEIQEPVTSATVLTLPLDSRNGNSTKTYIVGSGQLTVSVNGIKLDSDKITEIGSVGSISSTFSIANIPDLADTDRVEIRIEPTAASFSAASGITSLQGAYNAGASIVVASGNPITITGPVGEKLFRVIGDIEVTGIIDPAGLQLTVQSSDPFDNGDHGIYIDNEGDLRHSTPGGTTVNLTAAAAGSAPTQTLSTFNNNSGSTITKGTPVTVDLAGDLKVVDINSVNDSIAVIGVAKDDILDGEGGEVITSGRIIDAPLPASASYKDVVYVSPSGALIAASSLVNGSYPQINNDGYILGHHIISMGVVVKNASDPLKKDIIININMLSDLYEN